MSSIRLSCGNCGKLGDFCFRNVRHFKEIKPHHDAVIQSHIDNVKVCSYDADQKVTAVAFSVCPACHFPAMLVLKTVYGQCDSKDETKNIYSHIRPELVAVYPPSPKALFNEHYPEKIKQLFVDVQEMVWDGRSAPLIVAGCRSIVDVATKQLLGSKKIYDLSTRIDHLRKAGALTQGLADWSHALRLDGNQAVHDIVATDEQAEEHVEFLKLFLEVTFVLPKKISEKQK